MPFDFSDILPSNISAPIKSAMESDPLDCDAEKLKEFASQSKTIIEVGTFCGAMAAVMADVQPDGGSLTTIDTFRGSAGDLTSRLPPGLMKQAAMLRLSRFGSRVRILQMESIDAAKTFEPASVDMVFLDAAHDYFSCLRDIDAWLPIVKPTGFLVGHDFDKSCFTMATHYLEMNRHLDVIPGVLAHPGVFLAVMESFVSVHCDPNIHGSVWAARPEWHTSRHGDEATAI